MFFFPLKQMCHCLLLLKNNNNKTLVHLLSILIFFFLLETKWHCKEFGLQALDSLIIDHHQACPPTPIAP
jgi:hypothetical protein